MPYWDFWFQVGGCRVYLAPPMYFLVFKFGVIYDPPKRCFVGGSRSDLVTVLGLAYWLRLVLKPIRLRI